MKIKETKNTLTFSDWKENNRVSTVITITIGSIILFFLVGYEQSAIVFWGFIILFLSGRLFDSFTNYSRVTLDYKAKTIESTMSFFGITLRKSKLKKVNFEKLIFKEYQRNGGGLKKYILEYHHLNGRTVVYRVNKKSAKEKMELKIKTKPNKSYI
jgi:hypothetical protein